jgi:3-deoxy-D-manno-octulosonate 8-phosphate phosphatase (KDO 8-P phosphatase)
VTPSLAERCSKIEMLVLDVDGVLTEGGIIYGSADELKVFHVRDGSGLKIWHAAGKKSALVTGRDSLPVKRRAQELEISALIQGASEKLPAYERLLGDHKLHTEQAAVIGDDRVDVPMMRACGLAVAVADACSEARCRAHYVTAAFGGRGAARETIELILRCQGRWPILESGV